MSAVNTPLVTEVDGIRAELPFRRVRLRDGRIGYYQLGNSPKGGCLAAAVATATQTPLEEVPAMENWSEALAWAAERGWTAEPHLVAPPLDSPNWIGFVRDWSHGLGHCLVMDRRRIAFDPASGWRFPGGARPPTPSGVDYGLSFARKDNPC